jgi:hypothetical protein|tara:strand:+ start:207 stop:842 length:636 start_codon:yes stop_codon:yes gene_type:complete
MNRFLTGGKTRGGCNKPEGVYSLGMANRIQCTNPLLTKPLNHWSITMLSIKQLNQKIAGVRKSTAALRTNIHEILCNSAGHAYEHGDVTPLTNLYNSTSGMNRKKIAAWVRDNGFASLQKDGTYKINKSARNDAHFDDGHAVAMYLFAEVPAWFTTEESASDITRELDAVQRIKSLTSQVTKDGTQLKVIDLAAYKQAITELDDAIKQATA